MNRFHVRMLILAFASMTSLAATAQPIAPFPEKMVRFVVPGPAGTGVDTLTRAFAERFRAITGVPAVVENKVGANNVIGAAYFLSLPADGHSVLSVTSSLMNLLPLTQKLPYDSTRLRPLFGFSRHLGMFLASADSGHKTLNEVVAESKATQGGLDIGTYSLHFRVAMKSFERLSGTKFNDVPYKGPADLFVGLGGSSIPFAIADLGTSVTFVDTGKARPIAVAAANRHPAFPDVPTVAEAGYPGYEVFEVAGFAIHAETPEPLYQALEAVLARIASDPEYIALAQRVRGAVLTQLPGKEFASLLAGRRAEQRAMLEVLGELVK